MKNLFRCIVPAMTCLMLFSGCSNDESAVSGETGGNGGEDPVEKPGGYADPDGVLILNMGARMKENGSLTYLSPDGSVEETVYRTVNGTQLGNEAVDLSVCDGKIYILCNNFYQPEGVSGDGVLIVADAKTMKQEKTYTRDQFQFPRPPETNGESEYMEVTSLKNIVVLDEENIFFSDAQGLFRFNSTTGENTLIKGSYALANQGSETHNLETVVSTRGMLAVDGRLYSGASGYWTATKLLEFVKGKDEVNRELEIKGQYISGICQTGERELLVVGCGRGGTTQSFLNYIDLDTWTVTKSQKVKADLSAEFMNSSGVSLSGEYLYYAAGSTIVKRLSLKNLRFEEYIDVKNDAPSAAYLNCGVVIDPKTQYLYVAVSAENQESVLSPGNLLVYDCSGEHPVLQQNIVDKTSYPSGIYPVSRFY